VQWRFSLISWEKGRMKKKMCDNVKDGALKDDLKKYKKLVAGAQHVCKKCGRAAAKPGNLCKPSKL